MTFNVQMEHDSFKKSQMVENAANHYHAAQLIANENMHLIPLVINLIITCLETNVTMYMSLKPSYVIGPEKTH